MTGRVTVVGLGPAGDELITASTLELLRAGGCIRLRTTRHPAAAGLDAPSYDHLYDSLESFDEVYDAIVEDLVLLAADNDVTYVVPGSPTVAESTVDRLRRDDRIDCVVVPAMSFLDLAWSRLGIDPVATEVHILDGHRFDSARVVGGGPFLVAQCSSRHVLSDVKLAVEDGPESATLLHHLGLEDERIETVAWSEIDRTLEADHLTSLYIAAFADAPGSAHVSFDELVHQLRRDCPWDRGQTHGTLRQFLVEETYEVLEALDAVVTESSDAAFDSLRDELGDLLFQIVLHSVLAEEEGHFNLSDIAVGVTEKLIRRHPHVFEPGGEHPSWEELKAAERATGGLLPKRSALDSLPPLPGLALATKVVSKATRAGFAWPRIDDAWEKFEEEVGELKDASTPSEIEHEFGDLLFTLVTLAGHLEVDPETALRSAITRFSGRFAHIERSLVAEGLTMAEADLDDLLARWSDAKRELEG